MSYSRTATRKRARPLLGTFVEVAMTADDAAAAAAADRRLDDCITEAFAAIAEVEGRMSRYRAGSDLARLNGAAVGEWIDVHPSLVEVLETADRLFHESGGVFDVRCGAWLDGGMGLEEARPEIAAGQPPVEISGSRVRRTSPHTLDLGGIAKGYAVDRAVEAVLQRAGSLPTAGIVNAGGDLRVWGAEEQPVGIRIEGGEGALLVPIRVREAAVATSAPRLPAGEERAPRSAGHVRMAEGRLCQDAMTVTAIADRCLFADALTKIVMMASGDVARRCLSSYGAQALVFDSAAGLQRVLP
jgi:thiamine biosynthesis lipoprotein